MQINNNNSNVQQKNKKLKLEEKNKQNSSISKPALYTGLSIVGVAAFGIAGKILYDKLKKSDDNNPGPQQDKEKTKVELAENYNPNVTIGDKNYLVAFNQRMLADSYCFHNVWLQLLACPDIRCKKYGLPNTDRAISWINSVIAKEKDTMTLRDRFSDGTCYQSEAIDVPEEIRLQPEIKFKNPLTGGEINVTDYEYFDVRKGAVAEGKGGANFPYAVSGILDACYEKNIDVSNFMPGCLYAPDGNLYKVFDFNGQVVLYKSLDEVPAFLLDLGVIKISNTGWRRYGVQDRVLPQDVQNGNGPENFLAQIQLTNSTMDIQGNIRLLPADELIKFMQGFYGYKPTFGIMRCGGHYVSFYIIYNGGAVKRVLCNSGSGFEQYSDNDVSGRKLADFYEYIFRSHAPLWLKYSNKNIVEKYYTE